MIANLDLAQLVEAIEYPSPFDDEFEAIALRSKAMSKVGGVRRWGPDEYDEFHDNMENEALALGLHLTLCNRRIGGPPYPEDLEVVNGFAYTPGERWRLPSFDALQTLFYGGRHWWSTPLEHIWSHHLGYSKAQIRNWFDFHHRVGTVYISRTINILLPETQLRLIGETGFRALHPKSDLGLMTPFVPGTEQRVRPDAEQFLPPGVRLARFALYHPYYRQALDVPIPHPEDTPWTRHFRTDVRTINRGLETNVEVLGPDGWTWPGSSRNST